jgi:hypothetical protein
MLATHRHATSIDAGKMLHHAQIITPCHLKLRSGSCYFAIENPPGGASTAGGQNVSLIAEDAVVGMLLCVHSHAQRICGDSLFVAPLWEAAGSSSPPSPFPSRHPRTTDHTRPHTTHTSARVFTPSRACSPVHGADVDALRA